MPEWKEYNSLKFNGNMLIAGFSIYLLEIHNEDEPYYYVGMTGDSHFPSARSAFHRITGHLEINERSTQNQLLKRIKDEIKPKHLNQLQIKLHHFPIDGFEKYSGKMSKIDKTDEEYRKYKEKQKKVKNLEEHIIYTLSNQGIQLLNKTNGIKDEKITNDYTQIITDILNICALIRN